MPQSLLQKIGISVNGPGVVKGLPANLIPNEGFQDVLNVRFFNGVLQKAPGWSKFVSQQLTGIVTLIDQFFLSSGTDFLMVMTTSHLYKYNTGTGVFDDLNGTAFTGTILNTCSSEVVFDLFLVTNNVDTIKKWDGAAGTFSALGGLTDVEVLDGTPAIAVTTCGTIRFYKNFVVLLDVTENGTRKPSRVRWSRIGLPENWKNDGSGNGQAGAADIGTVDFIFTGERLSNSLAIYKDRSIWLMNYIGVPLIFDFREVISGVGAVGPRAVGNLGDEHIFVGNDDIYFFNGDSIESVGKEIRRYFFDNVHPKYIEQTVVQIVEEFNEAWISFSSTASTDGSLDSCIVFNYLERTWSIRDFTAMSAQGFYRRSADVTWATDSGSWDNPAFPGTWDERTFLDSTPINLLGDINGYVYQVTGNSKDGSAMTLTATSKLFDFGAPDKYKRAMRVQLLTKVQGNYSVTLYIGVSENIDDPVTYKAYTFNLSDTSSPFIDVDVTGRFFTFQFSLGGVNQDISLTGYNVYYIMRGPK